MTLSDKLQKSYFSKNLKLQDLSVKLVLRKFLGMYHWGHSELEISGRDCLVRDPQGSLMCVKIFYTSCLSIFKAQQV